MAAATRVCVVSTSHDFGGAEIYLARVVGGLRERFDFTALVPDLAERETVDGLREAGANVERVPGLSRLPSRRGASGMFRALGRLRPDLLHVNLTDQRDGGVPLLAARLRRVPTVATLNLVLPSTGMLKERIGRNVLRRADALIAVSSAVGDYLRTLGLDARVVRQGLAAPDTNPSARAALGLSPGEIVVGGVGRLHHQKGWDVLCAAAERVHLAHPKVRFIVIGDGPDEELIRTAAACRHVEFIGPRADASSLMGAFDLLAVPSRYEAFGLVALEAMLSGVPVVAARVGTWQRWSARPACSSHPRALRISQTPLPS